MVLIWRRWMVHQGCEWSGSDGRIGAASAEPGRCDEGAPMMWETLFNLC